MSGLPVAQVGRRTGDHKRAILIARRSRLHASWRGPSATTASCSIAPGLPPGPRRLSHHVPPCMVTGHRMKGPAMPPSDWRARAGTTFRCEKQPATGTARHGRHQPSAGLGGRRRDAGRRRQRDRRRDRRAVHADRGRADDGRHPRRRHGAYPPGRRPPRRDRQPEHGAARHRPDDLPPDPNAAPGTMDTIGRENAVGPTSVASPGQPEGLVRGAGALRHLLAGRRDGAGDPPRLARLPRHALSARMRHRLRRRHGARSGDREALSAGRRADRGRHAAGHRRLRRDAAQHRARRARTLLYAGALGAHYADHMATVRRLHHARRPDRLSHRSSARRCAAPIAASRSSGRRRHPPGRCTSSRCSTSWKATTSARSASARPTRCTCWPRC